MKKWFPIILCVVLALSVVLWVGPIIYCHALTGFFGHEFEAPGEIGYQYWWDEDEEGKIIPKVAHEVSDFIFPSKRFHIFIHGQVPRIEFFFDKYERTA